MSKTTLRWAVIVLGLATGLIHLALNLSFAPDAMIFTLNGLGYLAFVALFVFETPITRGREGLFLWAFIAYTAVTIIAYFALNGFTPIAASPLGYATKAIEVLLIGALWGYKN